MEPLLDTTDTESAAFTPRQLWYLGIDIYADPVTLQWQSPAGLWIDLGSYESTGRWLLNAGAGDVFRLTTSTAGSRVWVTE